MGTDNPESVRAAEAIDLPTMQKFVNFHYSVSVDLFGGEISTNGANFYTSGLKGRFLESRIKDDHQLSDATWPVSKIKEGRIAAEDHAPLCATSRSGGGDVIARFPDANKAGARLQLFTRAVRPRRGIG